MILASSQPIPTSEKIAVFVVSFFALWAAIGVARRIGPYILDYRIDDSAIRAVWFRIIPTMRIHLADIVEIRRASRWDLLRHPFALNSGTLASGDNVMITKSRGLFSIVFITPRDPRKFVEDVNQRLRQIRPTE
jgi:hypothetical protein